MKIATEAGAAPVASATLQSKTFHLNASGAAFTVLSDTLYSRKKHAVLREVGVNALEAHQMVGTPDVPIEVMMPTKLDPTFYIKDFGPGLDNDAVMRLYGGYFESTKSGDNTMAGGFGLGSKSPFALTDSFTVISSHKGMRRVYMAYRLEGLPTIDLRSEQPIPEDDPWQHGISVSFPIKPEDYDDLNAAAADVFQWFDVTPKVMRGTRKVSMAHPDRAPGFAFRYSVPAGAVNPMNVGEPPVELTGEVARYALVGGDQGVQVVMGPVAYPVSLRELKLPPLVTTILHEGLPTGIVLWLPIGAMQVAPSRESLSYSTTTKAYLAAALDQLANLLLEMFHDKLRSANLVEALAALGDARELFSRTCGKVNAALQQHGWGHIRDGFVLPPCPLGQGSASFASNAPRRGRRSRDPAKTRIVRLRASRPGELSNRGTPVSGWLPTARNNSSLDGHPVTAYADRGAAVVAVAVLDMPLRDFRAWREEAQAQDADATPSVILLTPGKGQSPEELQSSADAVYRPLGIPVRKTSEFVSALPKVARRVSSRKAPKPGAADEEAAQGETVLVTRGTELASVDVDLAGPGMRIYVRVNRTGGRANAEVHGPGFTPRPVLEMPVLWAGLKRAGLHYKGALVDELYLVDVRVAAKLERKENWVALPAVLKAFMETFDLAAWVEDNPCLDGKTYPYGGTDAWLWSLYHGHPEFRKQAKATLAGTPLLKLLDLWMHAASTPAHAVAAAALALQQYMSTPAPKLPFFSNERMLDAVRAEVPLYSVLKNPGRGGNNEGESLKALLALYQAAHARPRLVPSADKHGTPVQDNPAQMKLALVA